MNKAISAVILRLLARAGVAISGPLGWALSLIVDRFVIWLEKKIRFFFKYLKQKMELKKLKKEDEKNEQKYNEIINSDSSSESDIDNATSDFLNSGMQNNRGSKATRDNP